VTVRIALACTLTLAFATVALAQQDDAKTRAATVKRLVDALADEDDGGPASARHVEAVRAFTELALADEPAAQPGVFLSLLSHRDPRCIEAGAGAVTRVAKERPSWRETLQKAAWLRALFPVAYSERASVSAAGLRALEELTGERHGRDHAAWSRWFEKTWRQPLVAVPPVEVVVALEPRSEGWAMGSGAPVTEADALAALATVRDEATRGLVPLEVVAVVGSGASRARTVDLVRALAAKAKLGDVAEVSTDAVFLSRVAGWIPPVTEEAARLRVDAAQRDVARARTEHDLGVVQERVSALVDRLSAHPEAAIQKLGADLWALWKRKGAAVAKAERFERMMKSLVVTTILIDAEKGNAAIVVLREDGNRSGGRIYAEGDAVRDAADRQVPDLKVVKIEPGVVTFDYEGAKLTRQLKGPN
jgi:hypothetical protein